MEIYENLCHICNTIQENLVNVHDAIIIANEGVVAPRTLRQMLEYCLQLSLDDLVFHPQVICFSCIKLLQISYHFLKGFHQVQQEYCLVESAEEETREDDECEHDTTGQFSPILESHILREQPGIVAVNGTVVNEGVMVAAEVLANSNTSGGVMYHQEIGQHAPGVISEDEGNGSLITDARSIVTIPNDDQTVIANNQDVPMNGMENVEYWIIDNKSQYGNCADITTTTPAMVNFPSNYEISANNMPQLACQICAKRFFTQRALQIHLQITHKIRNHDIHSQLEL